MPNFSLSKPKVISNFFGPKLLEEVTSKHNGQLQVFKGYGSIYVTTGSLTQSGGIIKDLWISTFKKLSPRKNSSWLVLGLATGTVAKLISQKYVPANITGVEIDKTMLTLGKKYLDLGRVPRLTIINSNAQTYLRQKIYQQFDYILVDMYVGDLLPEFVYDPAFITLLQTHLTPDGVVVFNHLFYDAFKKQRAEELTNTLKQHFVQVVLHRALTNLLILCSRPTKQV